MIEETLREYASGDVPPSRLLAGEVLDTARRRHRRRSNRIVAVVAVVAAVTLVAGYSIDQLRHGTARPSAPRPGCAVVRLPVPPSIPGGVRLTGLDPSGRYAIGVGGTGLAPVGVRWVDGQPAVLAPSFVPKAVNASGVVVGFTGPDTHGDVDRQRPVVLLRAGLVDLPLPAGAIGGVAYGVNASGVVVGTAYLPGGDYRPVVWRAAGTSWSLTTLDGPGYGEAITDDDVVVGFTSDSAPKTWSASGPVRSLPVPSATVLSAAGGWAVGDTRGDDPAAKGDNPGDVLGLRWNLATGAVERLDGFTARVVNAAGMVGGAISGSGPAFWRDGRVYRLPVPAGGDPGKGTVAGIAGDGDLAGNSAVAGGPRPSSTDGSVTENSTGSVPVSWTGC
jgi:hypothetical protein